jgi:SAM-dependent methyltransferase
MQLVDLLSQLSNPISELYQKEFDYNYWLSKQFSPGLRIDDAWPAVCAIHDIWEAPPIEQVYDQIDYLVTHRQRIPQVVLDVGSGEGAASCILAKMGYTVVSIDCSPATYHYHRAISREFFGHLPGDNLTLYQSDLPTAAEYFERLQIDTVLLINGGHKPRVMDNIKMFIQQWHNWVTDSVEQFKKNQTQIVTVGPKTFWTTDESNFGITRNQPLDHNKLLPAFKNDATILVDTPARFCVKY